MSRKSIDWLALLKRSIRTDSRLLPLALAALSACGLPDYRVEVSQVPRGTVTLEALVFPEPMGSASSPTAPKTVDPFPVTTIPSTNRLSFTLDFVDDLDKKPTVVSVAARDASGCIIGVGSARAEPPDSSLKVTPVLLDLVELEPPVTSDRCRPKAGEATLLSVMRRNIGAYMGTEYQLQLYGWNLHGMHAPVVTSSAPVLFGGMFAPLPSSPMCSTGTCSMPFAGSMNCASNCQLAADAVPLGSALITLTLRPASYTLPLVPRQEAVIPFLAAFPLTVKLDPNASGNQAYTEGQMSY